jgi:polysaccharide export outer membrane protein
VSFGISLLALSSPAHAQEPSTSPEGPPGHETPLRPGDLIRLSGTRESDIPGDYVVDESGNVVLPLLGSRNVSGLSAVAVKGQLLADYRYQLRNQEVQVQALRRVRVLGAVKNPGIYHVDPTMDVADAVALAGGATQDGKFESVRILRGEKILYPRPDRHTRLPGGIQSGDQITVPERSWMSRNGKFVIGGLVSAIGIVVAASVR